MNKVFFLAVAALLVCGRSNAQDAHAQPAAGAQQRDVTAFTAIDVTDGIQLFVRDGQAAHVQVVASTPSLQEKIKTVVAGGVLKVYFDASGDPNWKGLVNSREEFKVYVSTQELQNLTAAKGAQVTLTSAPAHTDALAVSLLSGASLTGNVQVKQLDIKLRSGATARMTGAAATVNVRATEGSRFTSPRLQAEQCNAFAASASAVQLAVAKSLAAESVNEAVIKYSGPATLTKERREQGGKILHI